MIRLRDLLREDVVEKTSSVPIIIESLPYIKSLDDKTVLTRTFSNIITGAAKVITTPPKHQSFDKEIIDVYNNVMQKLDFSTLVYCSHGNRRFFKGDQYYMIPGKDFKVAWSPEVEDLLVSSREYQKANKLQEFPYESYTTTWPIGDVSEVLVDCKYYFLISTRIPIVRDYMKTQGMGSYSSNKKMFTPMPVETYDQLYTILEESIKPYLNRYDKK